MSYSDCDMFRDIVQKVGWCDDGVPFFDPFKIERDRKRKRELVS